MPTRKHLTDDSFVSVTSATPVGADTLLFLDATDNLVKKGLVSDLPAGAGGGGPVTYKKTSDQTGITSAAVVPITDLSFTPVANKIYRVTASIVWFNSGDLFEGITLGLTSTATTTYLTGLISSGNNNTVTSLMITKSSPTAVIPTQNVANNTFASIDLMFSSGASPAIFQLGCAAESGAGSITIGAGSSMTVEVMT